jgi:hypothetical protein
VKTFHCESIFNSLASVFHPEMLGLRTIQCLESRGGAERREKISPLILHWWPTCPLARAEPPGRTSVVVWKLPGSELWPSVGTSIGAPLFSMRRNPFSTAILWLKQPEQHKSIAQRTAFDRFAANFAPVLVGREDRSTMSCSFADSPLIPIQIQSIIAYVSVKSEQTPFAGCWTSEIDTI